jgi:LysR family cys regulon transcriptional activator
MNATIALDFADALKWNILFRFRHGRPAHEWKAMNLRQLRYICEIAKCKLNVSLAAQTLGMNQPGISKQVKLLEEELGFEIFERRRNRLTGLTPQGGKIIALAQNILNEVRNIRMLSQELWGETDGTLVIAATETQAHYFLPAILKRFSLKHPRIRITMRHADRGQVMEMLRSGAVDLGVTTQTAPKVHDIIALPVHESPKVIVVPRDHKLANKRAPTLQELADYPLITYDPVFTAGHQVLKEFEKEGLNPQLSVIAISADVIKACVAQGLGIGILSKMNYDAESDVKLAIIPAEHLFDPSITTIYLSRHLYLRKFIYDFIEMCASQWSRQRVQRAIAGTVTEDEEVV